jgi:hypothetical protein
MAGGPQQAHHRLAVDRVQGPGRLVGQQQAAVAHHGAGDRDPLALPARQLVGIASGPVDQAQLLQRRQPACAGGLLADAVQLQRQRHVLHRGQPGQQVEVLEDVADPATTQPRPLVARHPRQSGSADQHHAAARLLQAPGDRQQRALARAAGTHDRHQLAAVDR